VWDEVGFFTVDDGKIVAGRYPADMFGLRKALGIIPAGRHALTENRSPAHR
jgi:hypothetical protein